MGVEREGDTGATAQLSSASGAPALPADDREALAPETRLGGRYKIVRFLARGGMGEVYEAVDTELRATLAIKTVRGALVGDAMTMERVRREVQLARVVTHPNVCRIYDLHHADVDGQRVTYITMELLEGQTLRRRLLDGGPLSLEAALPLALDLLSGLDACHRAGVIHRDLKPENILLVRREEREHAMLTDFGIARTAGDQAGGDAVTQEGLLVGSIAFIAPEQFDGGRATVQTDLYGLGVILWELVVGPWPLRDKEVLAVMRILARDEAVTDQLPSTLEPRWAATIRGCLAPVARRFPTVRDAMFALAPDAMPPRRISEPVIIPTGAVAPTPGSSLAEVEGLLLRLDYRAARDAARALEVTPAGLLLLAQAQVGLGEWDAATATAVQARALGNLRRRTVVYFEYVERRIAGDLEGALALQEGMMRSAGDDLGAGFDHVDSLIGAGQIVQATELLDGLAAGALTPSARARAHLARVRLAYAPVDYPALERIATEAIELATAAIAPVIAGRALAYRGVARVFLAKPDAATADIEAAIAQLEGLGDVHGLALAYRARGVFAINTNADSVGGLAAGTRAAELATRVKDDELLALAENLRGHCFTEVGRIEETIVAFRAAEAAAVRGLREDIANTRPRLNMGAVLGNLGRLDEALAVYRNLQASRQGPAGETELGNLVEFTLGQADLASAGRWAEQLRVRIGADSGVFKGLLEISLAAIAYARGDDATFRTHLGRAEALSAEGGSSFAAQIAAAKVRAWLDQGSPATIAKLHQVAKSADIGHATRGVTLGATGRILLRNGRRDEAVAVHAELRREPLFKPYLAVQVQDALLAAELAQAAEDLTAAATRLAEVDALARSYGDVLSTWEASLGLAALERIARQPTLATERARSVHVAATRAGFPRYVARAEAELVRMDGAG